MLRPFMLLAAILLALLRVRTRNRLSLYLIAELLTTAVLEATGPLLGWDSGTYRWTYVLMRVVELAAVLFLTRVRWIGVYFALGLALTAYLGAHRPLSVDGWIMLLEGATFALGGISAALALPRIRNPKILAGLAIMWLLLGGYDLLSLLGLASSTNFWFPSWVVITAMLWISFIGLARPKLQVVAASKNVAYRY